MSATNQCNETRRATVQTSKVLLLWLLRNLSYMDSFHNWYWSSIPSIAIGMPSILLRLFWPFPFRCQPLDLSQLSGCKNKAQLVIKLPHDSFLSWPVLVAKMLGNQLLKLNIYILINKTRCQNRNLRDMKFSPFQKLHGYWEFFWILHIKQVICGKQYCQSFNWERYVMSYYFRIECDSKSSW